MEYSEIYVGRIRELCRQRGISINKLSDMSGVKRPNHDHRGGQTKNPRVKTLCRIALALNMTLSEFLDFDELNEYSFEDSEGN